MSYAEWGRTMIQFGKEMRGESYYAVAHGAEGRYVQYRKWARTHLEREKCSGERFYQAPRGQGALFRHLWRWHVLQSREECTSQGQSSGQGSSSLCSRNPWYESKKAISGRGRVLKSGWPVELWFVLMGVWMWKYMESVFAWYKAQEEPQCVIGRSIVSAILDEHHLRYMMSSQPPEVNGSPWKSLQSTPHPAPPPKK